MAKGSNAVVVSALVVVAVTLLLQSSEAKMTHVVGGAMNWTVPQSGGATTYTTWASTQNFTVGDILVFNFLTQVHDVAEVKKDAFDACNLTSPLSLSITGPTSITLTSAGEHYYICTVGIHCSLGQKLAINISAASTKISPAPQPAAAPTPSTSPAPAPSPSSVPTPTPSTPSPPASTPAPSTSATPPPVASTPSSQSPSGSTAAPPPPPPPPSNSSARLIAASAALPITLLSLAAVLLH